EGAAEGAADAEGVPGLQEVHGGGQAPGAAHAELEESFPGRRRCHRNRRLPPPEQGDLDELTGKVAERCTVRPPDPEQFLARGQVGNGNNLTLRREVERCAFMGGLRSVHSSPDRLYIVRCPCSLSDCSSEIQRTLWFLNRPDRYAMEYGIQYQIYQNTYLYEYDPASGRVY